MKKGDYPHTGRYDLHVRRLVIREILKYLEKFYREDDFEELPNVTSVYLQCQFT